MLLESSFLPGESVSFEGVEAIGSERAREGGRGLPGCDLDSAGERSDDQLLRLHGAREAAAAIGEGEVRAPIRRVSATAMGENRGGGGGGG